MTDDIKIVDSQTCVKRRINYDYFIVWRGEQDLPREPDPEKDGNANGDKADQRGLRATACTALKVL